MAELGETQDPTALIPGSPSGIHQAASALTTKGTQMGKVGDDLKAVTVPGWTGDAADAFEGTIGQHPPMWHKHGDDLASAATDLGTYADVLTTAQGRAGDAIALWNKAQQQSDSFATAQAKPDADPNATDPGNALRAEAQAILQHARTSVENGGGVAAGALAALVTGITFPLGGASASGSADGPGADASATGVKVLPDGTIQLGSAQAEAYLFKAQGSFAGDYAGIHYEGQGSVFAGADANASATIGADGLDAKAGAFAGIRADGDVSASYGYATVGAHGEAEAGAGANANAHIGPTGIDAGADAFAGAKASGSVSGDFGGVGGTGTAEGWAGVGADAGVDVGYEDGKITIGGHIGAALGLGGKLGGSITIDPGKVVDTVSDMADDVGDFAGDVGDGLSDAADTLTGGLL